MQSRRQVPDVYIIFALILGSCAFLVWRIAHGQEATAEPAPADLLTALTPLVEAIGGRRWSVAVGIVVSLVMGFLKQFFAKSDEERDKALKRWMPWLNLCGVTGCVGVVAYASGASPAIAANRGVAAAGIAALFWSVLGKKLVEEVVPAFIVWMKRKLGGNDSPPPPPVPEPKPA